MSNRHHLPAGQNIHQGGGGAPGAVPGVEMSGAGPRRRQPQYMAQYHQQQQQQQQQPQPQQQHIGPMYPSYMPYAPQGYYGIPPQFQNGAMPSPGYMPYQGYARSPPSMHQYVPMVGVSVPSSYPRPSQHSPSLSTPYQPPPAPAALPSQTPSSTHSQILPPPTPPTPHAVEHVSIPPTAPAPALPPPTQSYQELDISPIVAREPFRPPLPWFSRPDVSFPARAPRSRRRRRPLNADDVAVTLPIDHQHGSIPKHGALSSTDDAPVKDSPRNYQPTKPTPSALLADIAQKSVAGVAATEAVFRVEGRSAGPTAPVVPVVPRTAARASSVDKTPEDKKQAAHGNDKPNVNGAAPSATANETTESHAPDVNAAPVASSPVKAAPTSWADLFAKPSVKGPGNTAGPNGAAPINGAAGSSDAVATASGSTLSRVNASSLAEAIRAYRVGSGDEISFLEPRGLINTGNMCYMNSVLQVLMFCVPFYDFLDQVSKRAVHSFKSETPLVDAMLMFMREYKVLASAPAADQLLRKLKSDDFEKYGEPFTPEFVYEAIRQLPRFASMRRGHQQDAEEFLGFLLQSLDDECTQVMHSSQSNDSETASVDLAASQSSTDPSGDWLEVGRKQRAAVTRLSGSNSSTPITKIFGGLLRSEFRVPGLKDSITTEPYQPLQLDIGSPDVRNVVDALRGLTRPERLQGDFNSPRGKDATATKQVFIESLPPVLILHLKRFQFDAEGHGTIKIWKKVGYPLELEMPREALSRQKRQTMGDGAMPKYRLVSVVYHHGKNASGGHYTVDVRRQDGREWIRMDDTVLRRIRSEDVAEGGSEEEARDARKETPGAGVSANRFGAMNEEGNGDEDGWKHVTASAGGGKRWSSVVNGTSNGGAKEKQQVKESIKDNKVAYLLFYQRV